MRCFKFYCEYATTLIRGFYYTLTKRLDKGKHFRTYPGCTIINQGGGNYNWGQCKILQTSKTQCCFFF